MSLTRRINYYIDDGFYIRIPWDSWYDDGAFFGLSPLNVSSTVRDIPSYLPVKIISVSCGISLDFNHLWNSSIFLII